MNRVKLTLALFSATVVALPTTSATAATPFSLRITDAQTFRSANVAFAQIDASGCVETDLYQTATAGQFTEVVNGSITRYGLNMTAAIAVIDVCNAIIIDFLECSTSSAAVTIAQTLNSAALAATLTCINSSTNQICQLTKSETLAGTGDLQTGPHHFQLREAGLLINFGGRGIFRSATVTSATITGCGFNFSEQDATFAELGSSTGSTILITR